MPLTSQKSCYSSPVNMYVSAATLFSHPVKLRSCCQSSVLIPDSLCRCARSALQHLDDILAIPARQPGGMTHLYLSANTTFYV